MIIKDFRMEKIDPCKHCGSQAKLMVSDASGRYIANEGTARYYGRDMTHFVIICEKCGIQTKAYKTTRGVWKAWHRRPETTKATNTAYPIKTYELCQKCKNRCKESKIIGDLTQSCNGCKCMLDTNPYSHYVCCYCQQLKPGRQCRYYEPVT